MTVNDLIDSIEEIKSKEDYDYALEYVNENSFRGINKKAAYWLVNMGQKKNERYAYNVVSKVRNGKIRDWMVITVLLYEIKNYYKDQRTPPKTPAPPTTGTPDPPPAPTKQQQIIKQQIIKKRNT